MRFSPLFTSVVLFLSLLATGQASPAFDAACGLFEQHHFREAEAALRVVIAAEPANAAAFHTLGRTLIASQANGIVEKAEAEARVKEAAQWIARATELEPKNAAYLRDFGMSQITGVTSVRKGRTILEHALALDPRDPETHEFLAMLYGVPWMLGGDKDKAEEHRRTWQQLDPTRAALGEMDRLLWVDKNYPAAFSRSEALLQNEPGSALGHYLYGYAATASKTNLDRGLASLKKALALPHLVPTGNSAYNQPFSASPSYIWEKIGEIEGQLGHVEAARAAYTTAVDLDPANYWAAVALAKLKT